MGCNIYSRYGTYAPTHPTPEAMNDEQKQLDALNTLDAELSAYAAADGFAALTFDAAKLDADDLCEQYQRYRRYLELALGLIERIPVYGRKVAKAIRFLMAIADNYCPQ